MKVIVVWANKISKGSVSFRQIVGVYSSQESADNAISSYMADALTNGYDQEVVHGEYDMDITLMPLESSMRGGLDDNK